MTFRIAPPPFTAPLSKSVRRPQPASPDELGRNQRRPRRRQGGYLVKIRKLPCLICAQLPVDAAHIRFADASWGKRETGKAEKPDDKWTLPLSPHWHTRGPLAQHRFGDERAWWEWIGIDPLELCSKLWEVRDSLEAMEEVAAMYRLARLPEGRPATGGHHG